MTEQGIFVCITLPINILSNGLSKTFIIGKGLLDEEIPALFSESVAADSFMIYGKRLLKGRKSI